jgi:nuclear pore complex protein Nup93
MLDNWEAEKDKILQGELGVTEDEVINLGTTSNLGGSTLGKSTRKVGQMWIPLWIVADWAACIVSYGFLFTEWGVERRGYGHASETTKIHEDNRGQPNRDSILKASANDSQELNSKRLKREPYEICRSFEEVVKGDSVRLPSFLG